MPKVSLLLPILNGVEFLEKRMESILAQTLNDWELVVVDSFSTDGSWEMLETYASGEPRIKLHRNRQKGIYINFNECIRLAGGQYVYFATCDDLMEPDCIEKLAAALDANPSCGLAHCNLRIIDRDDTPTKLIWDDFFIVRHFGDFIHKHHIRTAPHDGIMHFSGSTVYTSLTQLMIRRDLFDRIGFFYTDLGSIADYEWEMRASLVTDTAHIPEYLANWRMHDQQATDRNKLLREKAEGNFLKMAIRAVDTAKKLAPGTFEDYDLKKLFHLLYKEKLHYQFEFAKGKWKRLRIVIQWLLLKPVVFCEWQRDRKKAKKVIDPATFLARLSDRFQLKDKLKPI